MSDTTDQIQERSIPEIYILLPGETEPLAIPIQVPLLYIPRAGEGFTFVREANKKHYYVSSTENEVTSDPITGQWKHTIHIKLRLSDSLS